MRDGEREPQLRLADLTARRGISCCQRRRAGTPIPQPASTPLLPHAPLPPPPPQVLMALSDSRVVVEETCRTLTLLAEHSPALAEAVVENDAGAIMRLLPAADEARQLSSLRLLAAIAFSSPAASARLATQPLLDSLQQLMGVGAGAGTVTMAGPGAGAGAGGAASAAAAAVSRTAGPGEEVRTAALKALGNLAFCADNRARIARNAPLMARLSELALSREEPLRVQVGAQAGRRVDWSADPWVPGAKTGGTVRDCSAGACSAAVMSRVLGRDGQSGLGAQTRLYCAYAAAHPAFPPCPYPSPHGQPSSLA